MHIIAPSEATIFKLQIHNPTMQQIHKPSGAYHLEIPGPARQASLKPVLIFTDAMYEPDTPMPAGTGFVVIFPAGEDGPREGGLPSRGGTAPSSS